ncbi:pepsin-like aspartic protease [Aspergillus lucknowensis]|uniref:Aspartic peptidase domain-containing protein n=1 Tax=Aspergillus lucknowensis TaxID=176173 RepID=A0ABR4LWZ5_9EURO
MWTSLAILALVGRAPAAPTRKASTAFDMPLTWTPFGFTTDTIQVGTPPQPLNSFVDWTWIGQYAFTPRCHGSLKDTWQCLQPGQGLYNQSQSSTFVNQSKLYPDRNWNPNHFFFYDDLSVGFGSDIQYVGPDHKAPVTLQLADMHFTLEFAYPFAGVFGLSPVFSADNASTQSTFYQMWEQGVYPSPLISFHYCYNTTFGNSAPLREHCNGADGLQTLGGTSPVLKLTEDAESAVLWYDNIVFPPVNEIDFEYDPGLYNYWALHVSRLRIGDEEQALNVTKFGNPGAIFDHASYGRGVPLGENSYNRLIEITAGQPIELDETTAPNNGNQSFVSVDCEAVDTFPVIDYVFEGHDRVWEVTPQNYVERIQVEGEDVCVLNVRTLGEKDFIIGNFGETFAKDKVILFDFDKLRVGIADVPAGAY